MKKTNVLVLESERLKNECPAIIGASGFLVRKTHGSILVEFSKNYYPYYDDDGEIDLSVKIPRQGTCRFAFFNDEVKIGDDVDIESQYMTRKDIQEKYGIKSSCFYKWRNNCNFPKPFNRGNPKKWHTIDVQKWEDMQRKKM